MTIKELKKALEYFNETSIVFVAVFKEDETCEMIEISHVISNGKSAQINCYEENLLGKGE